MNNIHIIRLLYKLYDASTLLRIEISPLNVKRNDCATRASRPENSPTENGFVLTSSWGSKRMPTRNSGNTTWISFSPSFSNFLSSHHGFEVDRRNGTPVGIGIVRNAFEAFAPDDEQKTVACELFDVAEKFGVISRIDYQWATDTMNCVPPVAKPCEGGTGFSSTFPTPFSDVALTSPPLGGVFGIILRVRVTD